MYTVEEELLLYTVLLYNSLTLLTNWRSTQGRLTKCRKNKMIKKRKEKNSLELLNSCLLEIIQNYLLQSNFTVYFYYSVKPKKKKRKEKIREPKKKKKKLIYHRVQ